MGIRVRLFDRPFNSFVGLRYDVGVSSQIDIYSAPFKKDHLKIIFSECPNGSFGFSKDRFVKVVGNVGPFEHCIWAPEIYNLDKGCIPADQIQYSNL